MHQYLWGEKDKVSVIHLPNPMFADLEILKSNFNISIANTAQRVYVYDRGLIQ